MNVDSRYKILFEPVEIGPVTAKNRFYQVPHCTGMGWLRPNMVADVRATKAEGGWGVVCTEYCSIHPTSDDVPFPTATLWNDDDIRAHRVMTDKVHEHGALAGVELWAAGSRSANFMSREAPLDVVSLPNQNADPYQSRAMSRSDIRDLRRWHRDAALRAKAAGFDIVYVYATHHYLLANFLNPTLNTRTDEYGGTQENRMRLIREIIEDTKDAVYVFLAIGVGLASGVQALGVGLTLSLIFNGVVLVLWRTQFGNIYADQNTRAGALGVGDVLAGPASAQTALRVGDPAVLEAASVSDLADIADRAVRIERHISEERTKKKDQRANALILVHAVAAEAAQAYVDQVLEELSVRWKMAELSPGPKGHLLVYLARLEGAEGAVMDRLHEGHGGAVSAAELRSLKGLKSRA